MYVICIQIGMHAYMQIYLCLHACISEIHVFLLCMHEFTCVNVCTQEDGEGSSSSSAIAGTLRAQARQTELGGTLRAQPTQPLPPQPNADQYSSVNDTSNVNTNHQRCGCGVSQCGI